MSRSQQECYGLHTKNQRIYYIENNIVYIKFARYITDFFFFLELLHAIYFD